ncbi:MAG: cyclic nucleotide-binding domain-containing protein [Deltaproteobacteria bacterium]|jgi:CRP/FNR family transcriptional regulator, cyclic AMP receptor protein
MSWSAEKNETCPTCEFQKNLNILREIYFFSALPIDTLKVFAYLCTRENFKPGDYLFTQDDDDGQAFYLVSGEAALIRSENGNEVIIRNYTEGDFSGALTLLGNTRRLFSMKASTPVTCLILSREKFVHTMNQYPQLMSNIFHAVVEKIHHWEELFLTKRSEGCEACRQKIGVSLI